MPSALPSTSPCIARAPLPTPRPTLMFSFSSCATASRSV